MQRHRVGVGPGAQVAGADQHDVAGSNRDALVLGDLLQLLGTDGLVGVQRLDTQEAGDVEQDTPADEGGSLLPSPTVGPRSPRC